MGKYIEKTAENNEQPLIEKDLVKIFKNLDIKKGDNILVHCSLSSLGYVIGGEETIFRALMKSVEDEGTIVVPTQTVEISDPSKWEYPPVPEEWYELIRDNLPPFNIEKSYSKYMGAFSNFVRTLKETQRSNHPMYSFAAYGKNAKYITENQPLNFAFGEKSPLEKLYNLNAKVLMIGTDFETNTYIHLAESYLKQEIIKNKSKMIISGEASWVTFDDIEYDLYDDYLELQKAFSKEHEIKTIKLKNTEISIFDMKKCVDFAIEYYRNKANN